MNQLRCRFQWDVQSAVNYMDVRRDGLMKFFNKTAIIIDYHEADKKELLCVVYKYDTCSKTLVHDSPIEIIHCSGPRLVTSH